MTDICEDYLDSVLFAERLYQQQVFDKHGYYQQKGPTELAPGVFLEVHVYGGEEGQGFEVRVWRKDQAKMYVAMQHDGPESYRKSGFEEMSLGKTETETLSA